MSRAMNAATQQALNAQLESRRRRWIRCRIALLGLLLLGVGPLIAWRAYRIQVQSAPRLRHLAAAQQSPELRLAPKRGTVVDRHGHPLAVSVEVDSIWASPIELRALGQHAATVADRLAAVLQVEALSLQHRLASQKQFVWLKRHATPSQAAAVRAMAIPGVHAVMEAKRYYPNRQLASHLLGVANVDGLGLEGIELAYDAELRGVAATVPAIRDRRGDLVFSDRWSDAHAAQGHDLTLTIDKSIQYFAEQELGRAVRRFAASSGSLVIVEPTTGELLALANYPTFNANDPGRSPLAARRNRAITDRFEPGSTIKPLVIAAALDAGVIDEETRIDCEHGRFRIAHVTIHDTHPLGLLSLAEMLAYSSNIGSAKVGRALGRRSLHDALRDFGFGQRSGIVLPGESTGSLRNYRRWFEVDVATIAFGHGISTTALQLAMSTAALANGGVRMRPLLVRRMVDGNGAIRHEQRPQAASHVVSRTAAAVLTRLMTGVTAADGTGVEAAIDGYRVAGKTGTAQKADGRAAGYVGDRWVASFAGFVPAERPRLAMVVVIDEPTKQHFGGVVAAPVFREVASQTLRYLGVLQSTTRLSSTAAQQPVRKKERG